MSKNFDFNNERIEHGLFVLGDIYDEDHKINPSKLFKTYTVRNPKEIDNLFCEKIKTSSTLYDLNYDEYKDIIPIIIELVIVLSRQKIPINIKKIEGCCFA